MNMLYTLNTQYSNPVQPQKQISTSYIPIKVESIPTQCLQQLRSNNIIRSSSPYSIKTPPRVSLSNIEDPSLIKFSNNFQKSQSHSITNPLQPHLNLTPLKGDKLSILKSSPQIQLNHRSYSVCSELSPQFQMQGQLQNSSLTNSINCQKISSPMKIMTLQKVIIKPKQTSQMNQQMSMPSAQEKQEQKQQKKQNEQIKQQSPLSLISMQVSPTLYTPKKVTSNVYKSPLKQQQYLPLNIQSPCPSSSQEIEGNSLHNRSRSINNIEKEYHQSQSLQKARSQQITGYDISNQLKNTKDTCNSHYPFDSIFLEQQEQKNRENIFDKRVLNEVGSGGKNIIVKQHFNINSTYTQVIKERDQIQLKVIMLEDQISNQKESVIKLQAQLVQKSVSLNQEQEEKQNLLQQLKQQKKEQEIDKIKLIKLQVLHDNLSKALKGQDSLESIFGSALNNDQSLKEIMEERKVKIQQFNKNIKQIKEQNQDEINSKLTQHKKQVVEMCSEFEKQEQKDIQLIILEGEKQELEIKVFLIDSLRKQEICKLKEVVKCQDSIIQQNSLQIRFLLEKINQMKASHIKDEASSNSLDKKRYSVSYPTQKQNNFKENLLEEVQQKEEPKIRTSQNQKNSQSSNSSQEKKQENSYKSDNEVLSTDRQLKRLGGQNNKNSCSSISQNEEQNESFRLSNQSITNLIQYPENISEQVDQPINNIKSKHCLEKQTHNNLLKYLNYDSEQNMQNILLQSKKQESNNSNDQEGQNDIISYEYLKKSTLINPSQKPASQNNMQQQQVEEDIPGKKKKQSLQTHYNYIETLKTALKASQVQRMQLEEDVKNIIQISKEIQFHEDSLFDRKEENQQKDEETASWGNNNDNETLPELEEEIENQEKDCQPLSEYYDSSSSVNNC